MDLSGSWGYLQDVAIRRLANNKTSRHVDKYGPEIETLGAAGEMAARRFLGLREKLHDTFDNGTDLTWQGYAVDVKALSLTYHAKYKFLQWPEWKPVKADIVLLAGVNMDDMSATVIGYATRAEVQAAPVNSKRFIPCHEIPITELRPAWWMLVPGFRIYSASST